MSHLHCCDFEARLATNGRGSFSQAIRLVAAHLVPFVREATDCAALEKVATATNYQDATATRPSGAWGLGPV